MKPIKIVIARADLRGVEEQLRRIADSLDLLLGSRGGTALRSRYQDTSEDGAAVSYLTPEEQWESEIKGRLEKGEALELVLKDYDL